MMHFLYDYDSYVEIPELTMAEKIYKRLRETIKFTLILTLILTVLKVSNLINSPYTVIAPIILHFTFYVIFCVVNYIKNYWDKLHNIVALTVLGLSASAMGVFLLIIGFKDIYIIFFMLAFAITLISTIFLLGESLITVSDDMSLKLYEWNKVIEHNRKVEQRKHQKQIHTIDKNEGKQLTDYEVIKNKKTLVFEPIRKGER